MRHNPATRIRPTAMALVLLAHVPLVLLFVLGWRHSRDDSGLQPVFIALWPTMQQKTEPLVPQPSRQFRPRAAPRSETPARDTPSVDPAAEPDALPAPSESTLPPDSIGPAVDWRAEGVAAAARQAAPPADPGFTPAPKPLRKPCEKPKSNWEWNPQPKKAGIAPLPYVVLGRCVVGLGFFACSPQKPPEANSHLLDDMRDGKASPSSVPDPERCD